MYPRNASHRTVSRTGVTITRNNVGKHQAVPAGIETHYLYRHRLQTLPFVVLWESSITTTTEIPTPAMKNKSPITIIAMFEVLNFPG